MLNRIIIILIGVVWHSSQAEPYTLHSVDNIQFQRIASQKMGVEGLVVEEFDGIRIGWTSNDCPVVLTSDFATPDGYRGPTALMLMLDQSMNCIVNVCLVESCDSPAYVRRALNKGLLSSLKQRVLNPAGRLDVDAVSGATCTSRAVEESLNAALEQLLLRK